MNLELKYAHAQVKALDPVSGVFEAIVSVFGNVDHGGDRVMPGAFARTLGERAAKGDPLPVIWSHEWDDPMSHVGYALDAREIPEGLWVKAQLDVEANPKAAYVARLLKQRRVTQFSFGYYAKAYNYVNEGGEQIRELTDVDLFEVGPTLLGGQWVQTSYNANIRGKYAAIGDIYDEATDAFVTPENAAHIAQLPEQDLINEAIAWAVAQTDNNN